MTTLHLIRHGQTNWNLEGRVQGQTDSVLTERGEEQAVAVAEQLKSHSFSAAYSSISIRAHETAKAILKHHQLDLTLREDMREIFLGPWEGQLYDDVHLQDPTNMGHFTKDPSKFNLPGAESFYQIQERAIAVVDELVERHPGQHILMVSHGIWIKTILMHFEQRPMEKFWNPPQMANCCHSVIEFNENNAKIVQYAGVKNW